MNDDEELELRYFEWLRGIVDRFKSAKLLLHLHRIPFEWSVPLDANRAEDGRALRLEFAQEEGLALPFSWLEIECSFLEMLIALARRMEFQAGATPVRWFWEMLDNCGLSAYRGIYYVDPSDVDEIVRRVIHRTYERSGYTGLFPIKHVIQDQRDTDLWYQMSAYLIERMELED